MLMPALPSPQGQEQQFYYKETLTEHFRREELEREFLELRSKMQDIYRSWHLSSWDQVGRRFM
jgi:hypothetical protein